MLAPMKSALITGITGQDGSYLAELLLSKGYDVHGLVRRASTGNTDRLPVGMDSVGVTPKDEPRSGQTGRDGRLELHYGDLDDGMSLTRIVHDVRPDEIYNLAAMSHVQISFEMPEYTASINGEGTVRLLEAIRSAKLDCRFYQASTSEMFGRTTPPQHEGSPFHPRSPYGTSKLFSHWCTINYREAYDLFAVSGILFNHESPRRGDHFVTRKVTRAVARIAAGLQDELVLGNLDAVRDWGYAPEYVEGMWLMLQHDTPEEFVLATGTGTTVRDFVQAAFAHAGLHWQAHVRTDERYQRPAEVHALIGNSTKAHTVLGWKAQTHAEDLARIMVDADIEQLGAEI